MKKFTVLASIFTYLTNAASTLAADPIIIKQPDQGIKATTPIGTIISNILTLVFSAAIILVLFYLIIGAFEWITSGGEKENVGKARGKIINALIGLAILALAFLIAKVAGSLVHVDILNLALPALDAPR